MARRRGDRMIWPMSAIGTKRTWQWRWSMSAFGVTADMFGRFARSAYDPKRTSDRSRELMAGRRDRPIAS